MTLAPKRRWFRFSLRTLFVVVTVACCWLGYYVNWAHQRRHGREWLEEHDWMQRGIGNISIPYVREAKPDLPWPLRMLGEGPLIFYLIAEGTEGREEYLQRVAEMSRLFPECQIIDAGGFAQNISAAH